MYVDVPEGDGAKRIRLGDFISCTYAELTAKPADWTGSALYYITDKNALAKWDPQGGENGAGAWTIINDTTALETRLTNSINANSVAIQSNATEIGKLDGRVDALEAALGTGEGEDSVLDRLDSIEDAIGEVPADSTVIGLINGLDGRLDTAEGTITNHGGRLTTAEGNISAIQTTLPTLATKASLEALDGEVDSLAGTVSSNKTELTNKIDGVETKVDNYISSNNTAVNGLGTRLTQAESDIDALQAEDQVILGKIGTVAEGKNLAGLIASTQGEVDALEGVVDTLSETVSSNKTALEKKITDGDAAVEAKVTALGTKVTANETAISNLQNDKADKSALNTLSGTVTTLSNTVTSNKEAVDAALDALTNATDGRVTLVEKDLAAYKTSNNSAVSTLQTDVADLKAADVTLQGNIDKKADKTALEALSKTVGDNKTDLQGQIDALAKASTGRVSVLEGKMTTAEGKISTLETNVANLSTNLGNNYVTKTAYNADKAAIEGDIDNLQAAVGTVDVTKDGTLQAQIKNVSTRAEKGITDAAAAKSAADAAATAAGKAQTTADGAVTAAGNAQSTADGAVTAAGNAQSTANSALTQANTNKEGLANLKQSHETFSTNISKDVDALEVTVGQHTTALNNIKNGTSLDSFADVESEFADVRQEITDSFAANDAMVFKGVINSASDFPSAPLSGWTYKVAKAGTYHGQASRIGDLFIYVDGDWKYVPSGNEETDTIGLGVSSVTGGAQIATKSVVNTVGDAISIVSENESLTVAASGSAVKVNMVWGTWD